MSSQILIGNQATSHAPPARRRTASPASVLRLPLVLALLGILAFSVDIPLSAWLVQTKNGIPSDVHNILGMSEIFGHGFGVGLWLLTLFFLDPAHRRFLPRVITASLGAGMVANGLKLLIERTRPYKFDFGSSQSDTFGDWLPLGQGGSSVQSFASSHTATAVGLAVALCWLYPRGRWLFGTFATLVAMQRLDSGYHYLSDVLVGAAVGALWAGLCTGGWIAGPQFERFESKAIA